MNILSKLIGNKVIAVDTVITTTIPVNSGGEIKIEIPVALLFVDYTLNIYNSFVIQGVTGASLSVLENLTVQDFLEANEMIILYFDNSVDLIVDMSDEGYNGPEALSLYGPDSMIVVWD
jgi:hypothetical protein